MSAIERIKFDAVMAERDAARAECERLRDELAALEALNAEAAKAGPIVDERIKELEGKLVVLLIRRQEQAAEIEQLRRDLAAEREAGGGPAVEQPEESELERRAWELFASAMSADAGITPPNSFWFAESWMAHRDDLRKAGAT